MRCEYCNRKIRSKHEYDIYCHNCYYPIEENIFENESYVDELFDSWEKFIDAKYIYKKTLIVFFFLSLITYVAATLYSYIFLGLKFEKQIYISLFPFLYQFLGILIIYNIFICLCDIYTSKKFSLIVTILHIGFYGAFIFLYYVYLKEVINSVVFGYCVLEDAKLLNKPEFKKLFDLSKEKVMYIDGLLLMINCAFYSICAIAHTNMDFKLASFLDMTDETEDYESSEETNEVNEQ